MTSTLIRARSLCSLSPGQLSFLIPWLSPTPLASSSRFVRFRIRHSSTSTTPSLIGSAPQMQRHLIIHTPHNHRTWPSHLDSTSILYRELGKRWGKDPRFEAIGFGISDALSTENTSQDVERAQEWDPTRNRFDEPLQTEAEEVYSATLYPDFIEIPSISLTTIPDFEQLYLALPSLSSLRTSSTSCSADQTRRTDIYVCTHGSRDCRCGDLGEPLYQKLVERASRRDLGKDRVRIHRVAHIGGHKFAANALVYRRGEACDWYGLLRSTDADEILDLSLRESATTPWYTRWRGRLGLSSEDAKVMYQQSISGATSEEVRKKRKEISRDALGDPIGLKFLSWDKVDEYEVVAYEGESVMEAAKRNDLPSILATCGGFCECATCHVHVDVKSSEVGWPEVSDEEEEQLDFAMGRKDDSRLGCQLKVTKELGRWIEEGGRIALPRY